MMDQPPTHDASPNFHPTATPDSVPPPDAGGQPAHAPAGQDRVQFTVPAAPAPVPSAHLAAGLTALLRLARHIPPPRELPVDERAAPGPPVDELTLLREAAALMSRLCSARDVTLLYRLPDGALVAVDIGSAEEPPLAAEPTTAAPHGAAIDAAQAQAILAATARVSLLKVDKRSALWRAMLPVRERLGHARAAKPERLVLLPVAVAGETAALLVVADPLADEAALALAQATAALAGAALQGLRLGHIVHAEDQARDSFISLVVHELRSPLTAIKGYSQLLLRQAHKLTLPPRIIHSADAIEQQSTRMADMIAEMHDAVRLRRGDLPLHSVRAELLPLVERAIAAQRALYPQHEIALDAPPEPLVGEWDPQRVEQVVGHLVNNAARYMPDGGTIGVRVAREEDGGRAVATIRVRDRGIGVAEADRERIFDYLYRTPETRRRNLAGLGIGLFLSRGLAERMGGRLWLADSRTGDTSGSTFCVALPLAEPPAKTHIWLR